LPWRLRVTEVDLDAGIDCELCVLGHLFALIPCQRLPEMVGEALDGRFRRKASRLHTTTATRSIAVPLRPRKLPLDVEHFAPRTESGKLSTVNNPSATDALC
jgi:hypothetical protein